jgi:hypothetical protein
MIVVFSRCLAWGYCRLLSRVNGKSRAKWVAADEVFDFPGESDKEQAAVGFSHLGVIAKSW